MNGWTASAQTSTPSSRWSPIRPERARWLAEQAIVSGRPLGPLHGVPVCIKDLFWTKGIRTTYGSKLFEDHVPESDAIFAERLRHAGAIIFAKNNTPEFGMNRRSLNLVARECLTPWDPSLERSSGGSSGGSAVSVAAGLGPVSIGSDSGGSIRIPSSFNGVFGFLASRGRIPVGPSTYKAPMQGLGPMTRDVRDAALAMSVIAGPDHRGRVVLGDTGAGLPLGPGRRRRGRAGGMERRPWPD